MGMDMDAGDLRCGFEFCTCGYPYAQPTESEDGE